MESILASFNAQLGDWERANILILGGTKVGKTTLVNSVFGIQIGETGRGAPITKNTQYFVSSDGAVGVYDTKGIELQNTAAEVDQAFDKEISELWDKTEIERIHLAWLVLSADRRPEASDNVRVSKLASLGVRTIVVVTHVSQMDGNLHEEHAKYLSDAETLLSAAAGFVGTNLEESDRTPDVFGLDELIELTIELAPSAIQNALEIGQEINFARKREKAEAIIEKYAIAAAAAGGQPVPLAGEEAIKRFVRSMILELGELYRVEPNVSQDVIPDILRIVGLASNVKKVLKEGINAATKPASEFLAKSAKFAKLSKLSGPFLMLVTSAAFAALAHRSVKIVGRTWIKAIETENIGEFKSAVALSNAFLAAYKQSDFNELEVDPSIIEAAENGTDSEGNFKDDK